MPWRWPSHWRGGISERLLFRVNIAKHPSLPTQKLPVAGGFARYVRRAKSAYIRVGTMQGGYDPRVLPPPETRT
jgi:hypothetical protein